MMYWSVQLFFLKFSLALVLFDGWLIIARSIQRTCITSSSNTPTFFFEDTENRATTFSGKLGEVWEFKNGQEEVRENAEKNLENIMEFV